MENGLTERENGMKKKYLLISIVLWTLVAVAVVGAIAYGLNGGFKGMMEGVLVKQETVAIDNVRSISIEGTHHSVEVRKTNGDSIRISQYGREDLSDRELFKVSVTEDSVRVTINEWYLHFYIFNFVNDKLIIEIPDSFAGDLSVKTSSGGVKVEDEFRLANASFTASSGGIHINNNLNAAQLNAQTSSGGVHIEGNIVSAGSVSLKSSSGGIKINGTVTAQSLSAVTSSGGIRSSEAINVTGSVILKSSSGSIRIGNQVTAQELQARTNSGGLHFGDVNVESFKLECTSGSIEADGISGGGMASASSGGIRLTLREPKGDISVSTSSGGIRLALDPTLQFTLEAKTGSGSIRTNFDVNKNNSGNRATAQIGDNPTVSITATAGSGTIRVER